MKKHITKKLRGLALVSAVMLCGAGMSAQNSLPAPGSGGSFQPNVGTTVVPNYAPGWNPGPPPPSYWGSPWYTGWNPNPTVVVSPSVSVGNFQNQGITKVIACGYDAQGVWRVLPMVVSYQYNGVQYVVNVLNAWNPWTDQWDKGVDVRAWSTDYVLRNITYDYYVVLPYGTFYFNL